jgi:release factor glutamine methyltransferase
MIAPPQDRAATATVATVLAAATARLAEAGLEQPRFEARVLLAAALATDAAAILFYPERALDPIEAERFADLVRRRAAREPTARLLGRREFWSLEFKLSPETLVPRPDSETLIEAALGAIGNRKAPLRLLDLGTGTGCLLLALLSELPAASGVGVDIAPGAVETARDNAAALGLAGRASFFVGSWADAIVQGFDVILANPPYIGSGAIAGLAAEVALHEPRRALDGGADGLDFYRALAPEAARLLNEAGIALFEIGAGQALEIAELMKEAGLDIDKVCHDLAGVERCIMARKRAEALTMRREPGMTTKKTIGKRDFPV